MRSREEITQTRAPATMWYDTVLREHSMWSGRLRSHLFSPALSSFWFALKNVKTCTFRKVSCQCFLSLNVNLFWIFAYIKQIYILTWFPRKPHGWNIFLIKGWKYRCSYLWLQRGERGQKEVKGSNNFGGVVGKLWQLIGSVKLYPSGNSLVKHFIH